MQNPFKFSSFRKSDLEQIKSCVTNNSRLVLLNSRGVSCSALVLKALDQLARPYVCIDLRQIVSVPDFAVKLLSGVLSIYPFEKIRNFLYQFNVVPTVSFVTNAAPGVSFATSSNGVDLLGDVFGLIEKISSNNLTLVFDEFQEVADLENDFAEKVFQIIQPITNTNFVFLGTKESSLKDLFANPRSVFYQFAVVESLAQIPREELLSYVISGLKPVFLDESEILGKQIVAAASLRPFYTQQLAAAVWDFGKKNLALEHATATLIASHSLDYERMWGFLNRTDRIVMKLLAADQLLTTNKDFKTSTLYSSAAKLAKKGLLAQGSRLEIEDPFFKKWIFSQTEFVTSKP